MAVSLTHYTDGEDSLEDFTGSADEMFLFLFFLNRDTGLNPSPPLLPAPQPPIQLPV